MALQYDPSVTFNAAYNMYASNTLAAGANISNTVDFSSSLLGGFVQIWNTGGGTVAATNGCQVQVFATADTTPSYDTVPFSGANFVIATVTSTAARQSIFLPTGKYSINLKNLDVTNAITVGITSAPVA